jgi:cytochrome c-type biogenesis protein CcmE
MGFNEAKNILNKKEEKYTDQEVKKILQLLQVFVKQDLKQFQNEKSNTIH